jgi:microcystin-dependent protein
MATPYLSEIKIVSFNFAPKGWALCNGQLLPINQNQALFSLLGTTYGGDGRVNFALPNLQGCIPVHMGSGFTLGQRGGESAHTLIQSEMPAHIHPLMADGTAGSGTSNTPDPSGGKVLGVSSGTGGTPAVPFAANIYNSGSNNMVAMDSRVLTSVGGSQPHENRSPFLTLNFVIALQGIFPSQT